jgi:hypothetical protein
VTHPADPAVGVNADGRLEVFVVNKNHTFWHRWHPLQVLGNAELRGQKGAILQTFDGITPRARHFPELVKITLMPSSA